jgi:hypothetical protein
MEEDLPLRIFANNQRKSHEILRKSGKSWPKSAPYWLEEDLPCTDDRGDASSVFGGELSSRGDVACAASAAFLSFSAAFLSSAALRSFSAASLAAAACRASSCFCFFSAFCCFSSSSCALAWASACKIESIRRI